MSAHKAPTKSRSARNLSARAHCLIPGGAHTYAKGDDQYPENAPGLIVRGLGCRVWDVDGNEYIEYGMGLRSVALGHAYPPVVEAARRQLALGSNFTRPAPIEGECAEVLLALVPGLEQVKFAKDGSTVITAAIRLARAYTGRKVVAYCSDHPFFSYNDWFIGGHQMSAGIPPEHLSLAATFRYNDPDSLRAVFDRNPGEVACVLMEPERDIPPRNGFLEFARDIARNSSALLIFDEMITGFRWHNGGAQTLYGVRPDLCGFGKAMANGFSVSALAGRREIMQLGGWEHNRDRVFLLSTTHGAETHALAAAIATMEVYRNEDVIGHMRRQGERLRDECNAIARELGISSSFDVRGHPANLTYTTRDASGNASQLFRTLFMQEMIHRGILGPSFVLSYSHADSDVDRTLDAVRGSLEIYRRALQDGVERLLVGRPVQPVDRNPGDGNPGSREG